MSEAKICLLHFWLRPIRENTKRMQTYEGFCSIKNSSYFLRLSMILFCRFVRQERKENMINLKNKDEAAKEALLQALKH